MRIRHVAGQGLNEIIHEKTTVRFGICRQIEEDGRCSDELKNLPSRRRGATPGFDNLITTKVLLLIFLRKRDHFGNVRQIKLGGQNFDRIFYGISF